MPVIQGSSAYSTKAELIPGIWRGFSAVQLLPVLSAGLGCSFGQNGRKGGFFCLFPVAPSSLSSLALISHAPAVSPCCLSPSLLWATVPRLRLSLPLLIWCGFSLWLLLAVSPVPRLWRWRSSLCPCFSPSSLCYRSALRGLPSLCPCLASAVCPPAGRGRPSVSLSGRHDLHRLRPLSSVCPSTSGGWLAVCADHSV